VLSLPFLPFKIFFFLGRTLGWTRLLLVLVGIAVGLLVAPTAGVELREKLKARAAAATEPALPA
jgi:gas vesicle protein